MDTKLHLSRWNPTGSAEATWPAAPPSSTTPLQLSASRLSGNMTLKLNNNNKEKNWLCNVCPVLPLRSVSPLNVTTSSSMAPFLRLVVHSSWVGGKTRTAGDGCCRAVSSLCWHRDRYSPGPLSDTYLQRRRTCNKGLASLLDHQCPVMLK